MPLEKLLQLLALTPSNTPLALGIEFCLNLLLFLSVLSEPYVPKTQQKEMKKKKIFLSQQGKWTQSGYFRDSSTRSIDWQATLEFCNDIRSTYSIIFFFNAI